MNPRRRIGNIDIHRALTYQSDITEGKHTAKSGLFLRDHPGRLVLYPMVAATCCMIFFGGQLKDAAVAAVCGLVSGLIEWSAGHTGTTGKFTLDVIVGIATGAIAGFVYSNMGEDICMSSILMGNLYWFFYGTAFVIGLLEIMAGELETGVTRFIAVSVKTFVLCLGAGFGMMFTMEHTRDKWIQQNDNCGLIALDEKWWRIPLYLLCSASVLGQYRMPIRFYWRGLLVQLAAYEVQYQVGRIHNTANDNMDYALSNTLGAIAATLTACLLSFAVEHLCHGPYQKRILHIKGVDGQDAKAHQRCCYAYGRTSVQCLSKAGIGRKGDLVMLEVEKKMQVAAGPDSPDQPIMLEEHEEAALLRTIVELEGVWALATPRGPWASVGSLDICIIDHCTALDTGTDKSHTQCRTKMISSQPDDM